MPFTPLLTTAQQEATVSLVEELNILSLGLRDYCAPVVLEKKGITIFIHREVPHKCEEKECEDDYSDCEEALECSMCEYSAECGVYNHFLYGVVNTDESSEECFVSNQDLPWLLSNIFRCSKCSHIFTKEFYDHDGICENCC